MAGIQLPKIQKVAPQQSDSYGRISTDIADPTQANAAVGNAISNLASTAGQMVVKFDEEATERASIVPATEYKAQKRAWLAQAKAWEGDPAEMYNKLAEEEAKWRESISEKYKNSSDRVKQRVQEKMLRIDSELNDEVAVQRAIQTQAWDKSIVDKDVELKHQDLMGAAQLIDIKDERSFDKLRIIIDGKDGIKDTRIKAGHRMGSAKKNADGTEDYAPSLKLQIKKDVSDGLYNVVQTLNLAGRTEEAKKIMEEFDSDILAETKVKLAGKVKDADLDKAASQAFAKVRSMDPDKALEELEDTIKDPEVLEKAIGKLDTYSRRVELIKNRSSKQASESIASLIYERSQGKNPFLTLDELHSSEVYKAHADRLTDKQRRALDEQVVQPKKTDPAALEKAWTMISGDVSKMSPSEFNEALVGISREDRRPFETIYRNAINQTDGEKNQMVRFMSAELKREAERSGLVKLQFGKMRSSDREKYNNAMKKMWEQVETFPPGTNAMEQRKWVQGFVQSELKGQAFKGLDARPKLPSAAGKTEEKMDIPKSGQMNTDQKKMLLQKFQEVKGRPFDPKKGDTMNAFILELQGKKK